MPHRRGRRRGETCVLLPSFVAHRPSNSVRCPPPGSVLPSPPGSVLPIRSSRMPVPRRSSWTDDYRTSWTFLRLLPWGPPPRCAATGARAKTPKPRTIAQNAVLRSAASASLRTAASGVWRTIVSPTSRCASSRVSRASGGRTRRPRPRRQRRVRACLNVDFLSLLCRFELLLTKPSLNPS